MIDYRRSVNLVLLLFLLSLEVFGQKVVIKGKAIDFEKNKITASEYKDYVSLLSKSLDVATISADHSFELTIELTNTTFVNITIGRRTTSLYCEPGKVYNVTLKPSTTNNQSISLNFPFHDPSNLNSIVREFSEDFNNFYLENEKLFVARRASNAVKEFSENMMSKYGNHGNPFFSGLVHFELAMLKESTLNNKVSIYKQFFKESPVRYNNLKYTQLFKQFYKRRLEAIALGNDGFKLLAAVNGKTNYAKMISTLKTDEYMNENDSLLELFAINGLKELYYEEGLFEKEGIQNMLTYISRNGIFKEISANVLFGLTYLNKGTKAPDFQLTNQNGKKISLSALKGKAVYLQFWSSRSADAMREMILINKFSMAYSNKAVFISINSDSSPDMMNEFIQSKSYSWNFCHESSDPGIFERYQIYTQSAYVLIDKEGNIVSSPAKSPSQGIEEKLKKL